MHGIMNTKSCQKTWIPCFWLYIYYFIDFYILSCVSAWSPVLSCSAQLNKCETEFLLSAYVSLLVWKVIVFRILVLMLLPAS